VEAQSRDDQLDHATVDIVSGGRLDFGIGAGSRPGLPLARREYEAHGLPFHDSAHAVGSLAEACTVIRRLWTEAEPFDVHGTYLRLTGRRTVGHRRAHHHVGLESWDVGWNPPRLSLGIEQSDASHH